MTDIFKEFLAESKGSSDSIVSYRPVKEYRSVITGKQAMEDLEELRFLMDNRYSGKDYWQWKGIDFSVCLANVEKYLASQEKVYISDFCRKIHQEFDVGIVDNHLSFASPFTGRLHFSKQFAMYFADLLLEKRGEKYIVIESKEKGVVSGDQVESKDKLFPTLAPEGKERYLVGERAFQELSEITISVNGEAVSVPVHRCLAGTKTEKNDVCMRHKRIRIQVRGKAEEVDIFRSNCCDFVGELTEDTDLEEMGRKCRNSRVVILNYLSNEGGYNRITRDFIKGLNDYVHCEEYSMKLVSPVTEGKDCKREWVTKSEALPYQREKGTYEGLVIMLVNSDTASSGETAVLYAKSLKNFILMGENTMGCNTFGNVADYQLPHSQIVCRIPNVINLCGNPSDCMEGHGFTPDYWVDSRDVEGKVLNWLFPQAELR